MIQYNNRLFDNYEETLNFSSDKISYIGSRSLFDPNFIPTSIISKKKKFRMIHDIVADAFEDNYSTNLNLYGLKGSGKNLLVSLFLQQFTREKTKTKDEKYFENTNLENIIIINIDCTKKEPEQIFFELIMNFVKKKKPILKIEELMKFDSIKLWNTFKFLVSKIEIPVLLYIQNAEYINPNLLDKFYFFAKNCKNVQIITSLNTGIQKYQFKNYEGMQYKLQMDGYQSKDLKKITEDRCKMAFKIPFDSDCIELIVDYISDYDVKVPGACINYLKELYPKIKENPQYNSNTIRNLSQFHFNTYNIYSFSLADYIMDTSIEDRLFLEYIVNFFQNKNNYYIPFNDIRKSYRMASEELGFIPDKNEFYQSLSRITNYQILRPSMVQIDENKTKINGIYEVSHFLTLPIEDVNEIMNISFG